MDNEVLARRYAREARIPRASRAVSRAVAAVATRIPPVGNLMMPWMVPPTAWAFLYEPHRLDPTRGRAIAGELLGEARGGALGVTGVREIVLGVADLARERRRWDALLAPLAADDGRRWTFGDGPAIRAEQSASGSWQRLVLDVSSLARARNALEERGMLHAGNGDEVRVAPRRLAGLELRLHEAAVPETVRT